MMVKKSCKNVNKLLKIWNDGKVPKTKKDLKKVLGRVNNELGSGWWAPNKEALEQLRCMKYGLQDRLHKM